MHLKKKHMNRTAFTMLELILVIVVLGILAALAMPRLDRDLRQEAEDNILSAIRYTQHLALIDDKTNPSDGSWQKKLWMIQFTQFGGKLRYRIGADTNGGGAIDKVEAAIDPINGKYIYNNSTSLQSDESPNVFLGKKYGIDSLSLSGSCTSQHIAFDNLGRPFNGITTATNNFSKYMTSACTMAFGFESSGISDLIITISQETGYVSAN